MDFLIWIVQQDEHMIHLIVGLTFVVAPLLMMRDIDRNQAA